MVASLRRAGVLVGHQPVRFLRRAFHGSRANADGADDIQIRLSAVVKPKMGSSGEHRTRLSEKPERAQSYYLSRLWCVLRA